MVRAASLERLVDRLVALLHAVVHTARNEVRIVRTRRRWLRGRRYAAGRRSWNVRRRRRQVHPRKRELHTRIVGAGPRVLSVTALLYRQVRQVQTEVVLAVGHAGPLPVVVE